MFKLIATVMVTCLACCLGGHEEEGYRVYDDSTPEHVKEFYRFNHTYQTVDFVLQKKQQYLGKTRAQMSIWEAIALIDKLVDESDPDLDLPQSYHFYQTAEAMRKAGLPRWLILTGFIHDLGKVLAHFGEPQWAVVGDTFPVGCAWSEKIAFYNYFQENPDRLISEYQTKYGIYSAGCGLKNLHLSWGHDEYLYQVVKDYLPKEGAFIIRYHSFYPLHRAGEYAYFLDDEDKELLPWLRLFQKYDLYSKSSEKLDLEKLRPYYEELVSEFFPEKLAW